MSAWPRSSAGRATTAILLVLALVDVDNSRLINDWLSDAIGDATLRQVAAILHQNVC